MAHCKRKGIKKGRKENGEKRQGRSCKRNNVTSVTPGTYSDNRSGNACATHLHGIGTQTLVIIKERCLSHIFPDTKKPLSCVWFSMTEEHAIIMLIFYMQLCAFAF